MKVLRLHARQIFDSRGLPTVECDVLLGSGGFGRAAVPSGASTGSREAIELRDGEKAFGGKGVSKALANIDKIIAPALIGQSFGSQAVLDNKLCTLDGSPNKSKLGANAILAVSLACAKACAAESREYFYQYVTRLAQVEVISLPLPLFNILNGGKHALGSTDVQEFMIVPVGATNFAQALQMGSEVYHALGEVLASKQYATTVGDEGGYAPSLKGGTVEAIESIIAAITAAGYAPGKDVALALDVAASELFKDGKYVFAREGKQFSTDTLIAWYQELTNKYPIISVEDGLSEDDWNGWISLTQKLGTKIQLVGDDLLVTNTTYLNKAIQAKAANAILIKPNQIGTLTETISATVTAQKAGWRTIISHRSGETEDTTIAHLAVGLNAGQIKSGSLARSERVAKYNELLRIAETLPNASLAHPF